MTRTITRLALLIVPSLAIGLAAPTVMAAPDAPATPPSDSERDGAGAPATPPGDVPATPPADASASPPADAPASRPTDAGATPATPPGDAPAGPANAPAAGAEPDAEPEPDPNREASSKEAGAAMSGEAETVGEVESERIGKKEKKEKNLSHYQTGGVTVAGGWGFYGVVPYNDNMYCGEFSTDNDSDSGRKSFCTNTRGVAFMEFGANYGAHPRLDIVVNFRLNMMKRKFVCKDDSDPETCKGLFNDSLGFGLFPGIRGWISKPTDMFKLGAAIDFMWMHEKFAGYRGRPRCIAPGDGPGPDDVVCPRDISEPQKEAAEGDVKDDDVGVRLGLVLQLDPHHNFGIFLMPTARMGFLRWFEFAVDIQLGITARFP